MKQDLALRDVPVIVTSSLEGIDHVVRCVELGAEDYLHKPVNPVLLKARIGASLEKKRLRDQQKELLSRFRRTRGRGRSRAVRVLARRPPGARDGDVRRHPRLHAALPSRRAREDDRAPQQLLRAACSTRSAGTAASSR
jgi:DNA-binding response OmpR family regulator